MNPSAGRLIPPYTEWGTDTTRLPLSETETHKDRFAERKHKLATAPNLDNVIREEYKEAGLPELPGDINWGFRAVMCFRERAKDAAALGEAVKTEEEPERKRQLLQLYRAQKAKLALYLEYGGGFERAYREYIRGKNATAQLRLALQKTTELEAEVEKPLAASASLSDKVQTRVETVLRNAPERVHTDMAGSLQEDLDALAVIYGVNPKSPPEESDENWKNWKDYQTAANELLSLEGKPVKPIRTEAELKAEIARLRKESERLWSRTIVRNLWKREEMRGYIEAVGRGDRVIETQTVIGILNQLDGYERRHQNTTVGGVLVGPPGVGKTTIVRHYLEKKNRGFVYIDLSEDVTRYLLYGSKAIEFKHPADRFRELAQIVGGLSEAEFVSFVTSNATELENLERLKQEKRGGESAVASFVGMLGLELQIGLENPELSEEARQALKTAQETLTGLAKGAFVKELGKEFAHIVSRNGWRDGIVIAALRRGDSIIFDEFPQFKGWAALHSLMTERPGEKWKFADNVEEILIPEDWRMYFTGNIGRRYNSPVIPDNLSQRVQGEVINMDYPPSTEEMGVAWALMSKPNGTFLRSKEDFMELCIFIDKCLPGIRAAIETERQSIPISYRTLGVLAEKLVVRRDPKTRKHVYTATQATFGEALYSVLIESQGLYESKDIAIKTATVLVNTGLLLDPAIEDKVVALVGKNQYTEAKNVYTPEQRQTVYDDIMEKRFKISKRAKNG